MQFLLEQLLVFIFLPPSSPILPLEGIQVHETGAQAMKSVIQIWGLFCQISKNLLILSHWFGAISALS